MFLLLLDQLLVVSGANSTWEKSDSENDSEIRIRLDSESEDEILVASEDDPTWEMLDSEIISLHERKQTKWICAFGQQGMTGCINSEGKIILIGGETFDEFYQMRPKKKCWIYDNIRSPFPERIKMLEKRAWSSSTLLYNELIWIVGGKSYGLGLCSTELLDIHSGKTKRGKNLPFTIKSHCTVEYNEHSLYIIGGLQNEVASRETWIVNPEKDFEIAKGPHLKFARFSHSCDKMELDGEVVLIVAGGYDGIHALNSVEILRPNKTEEGWIPGPDLSCKTYNSCMVTSFDGKGVILIGGHDSTNARDSDCMLEMHSLRGMNWKFLGTRLKQGRKGHIVLTTSSDKCQAK